MPREERRLYTVGAFWLAERAESPFLQIRWYDEGTKTTRGKSTRKRTLDEAIPVILEHEQQSRSNMLQPADQVLAMKCLRDFWTERGRTRKNAATIASSFRIFYAFLMQDRVTEGATVAELAPDVFKRFIHWRQNPHHYLIEWLGETYEHASGGVSGEAIQRNLDDVRAALNHAEAFGRIPHAPKVRSVDTELRSPPRDVTLSVEQLGAIVGYAAYDGAPALRWILGMLATGARPDAVLAWNIGKQWRHRGPIFDTHPHGWAYTKKRNATVPVIAEFRPWLEAWADCPHKPVKSRKRWWRTMRAALGMDAEVVPKAIRHTVATELRARGVPPSDVEGLLGHRMSNRTTAVYAKYDPTRLSAAKQALSALWREVCASANDWLTNHIRISPVRGQSIEVARKREIG